MKLPEPAVLEKVRQWVTHGDEDLRIGSHGFTIPEAPPYRLIAFHAQQCAEKYLKAYLVFKGEDFPFTHNLRRLLDLCGRQAPWAEQLRDAEELNPYASTARYTGEDLEVSEADARRAIKIAEQVREAVTRYLREEGVEIS